MVFEIYLDSDDRFRWHLLNHKGQIVALAAEAHGDLDEVVRSLAAVRDSNRAEIRHPQG